MLVVVVPAGATASVLVVVVPAGATSSEVVAPGSDSAESGSGALSPTVVVGSDVVVVGRLLLSLPLLHAATIRIKTPRAILRRIN